MKPKHHLKLQGDSISQWWQWQGSTPKSVRQSRPPLNQACHKANVVRTSSLKAERNNPNFDNYEDDDEDDDVFVTADPVRGQHVTVKSAIISTTNPYCTSARVSKRRFHNSGVVSVVSNSTKTRWDVSNNSVESSAPSPSSDSSESSLVLSSSASSTSSHSPHANTSASILSHDQVIINQASRKVKRNVTKRQKNATKYIFFYRILGMMAIVQTNPSPL